MKTKSIVTRFLALCAALCGLQVFGETTTTRVMSFNVANTDQTSGGAIDTTSTTEISTLAGNLPGTAWQNICTNSSASNRTGSMTGVTVWNGTAAATESGVTVSWNTSATGVAGIYSSVSTSIQYLKSYYGRESQAGINDQIITISGIPYGFYDVIVYLSAGPNNTTGKANQSITFNDIPYYGDPTSSSTYKTVQGSNTSWGALTTPTTCGYGTNALRVVGFTSSTMTVKVPSSSSAWGIAAIQIVERTFSNSIINPVTQTSQSFDNVNIYTGTKSGAWADITNWVQFANSTVSAYSNPNHSNLAPHLTNSENWNPALFDGSITPNKQISVTSLEGWASKFILLHDAKVTVGSLVKFQSGANGVKWFWVDNTSKMTINGFGGGTINNDCSYYVASKYGVDFECNFKNGDGVTYYYNLTGDGSVKYNGSVGGTHTINRADFTLTQSGAGKTIREKQLISFTSNGASATYNYATSGLTVNVTDPAGTITSATRVDSVTADSDLGYYAFVKKTDGYYLQYVDRCTVYTATVTADTKWSDINWSSTVSDAASAEMQLTVQNNATVTLDTTETYGSLVVNGNATLKLNPSMTTADYGAAILGRTTTKSCTPIAKVVSAGTGTTISYAANLAPGYTFLSCASDGSSISFKSNGNLKMKSININYCENAAAQKMNDTSNASSYHGAYPVLGSNWSDVSAANNANGTAVKVRNPDGSEDTSASVTVSIYNCANSYNMQNRSVPDKVLYGYVDDGSSPIEIIQGIPFAKYRLVMYFACDTAAGVNFGYASVYDGSWNAGDPCVSYCGPSTGTTGGTTIKGTSTWGYNIGVSALTEGVNYIVSDVMTGTNCKVQYFAGSGRSGMPALQIIDCSGENRAMDYTADVTGNASFASGDYINSAYSTITLTNKADSATVTFNSVVTAKSLKVVSATGKTLTLAKADAATVTIPTCDFSESVGQSTVSYNPGAVAITGNFGVTVAANAEMTMSGVVSGAGSLIKLGGGSLTLSANNTLTGEIVAQEGTIKMGANNCLNASNAARVKDGGTLDLNGKDNVTYAITMDGGVLCNNGTNCDLNHTQVKTLTLNGNAEVSGTGAFGMIGGSWLNATINLNTYTLTKKGTGNFFLTGTTVNGTGKIAVEGGTILVKKNNTTFPNGTFELSNGTIAMDDGLKLSVGTFSFAAGSEGATRQIQVESGTATIAAALSGSADFSKTGSGTLIFGDGSSLSGYSGTITVSAGTVSFGSIRDFSSCTVSVTDGASIEVTPTRAETGTGDITVTGLTEEQTIYVSIGGERRALVADSTGKATGSFGASISGNATYFDVTFTNNVSDIGKSGTSAGTITYKAYSGAVLKYDNAATFTKTAATWDDTAACYIRCHPYIDSAASAFASLTDFSAVIVGCMSSTDNTQFIHIGSSDPNYGHTGVLIATTAVDNQVMITVNKDSVVNTNDAVYASVPNAATVRHAYVITKTGSVMKVYVDGTLRGQITLADGFTLGTSSHSGIQVGSDFGGKIRDAGVWKAVQNVGTETGYVDVIRVFDYVLSADQAEKVAEEYGATDDSKVYTRPIDGDANLSSGNAWTLKDTTTTVDLPEASEGKAPSAVLTVNADATLTLNAALALNTLTIGGEKTLTITGDKQLTVADKAVITSPIKVAYNSLVLAGTPIQLSSKGAIEFDLSSISIDDVYEHKTYQLTGLMDETTAVTIKDGTLPTAKGRTAKLTYSNGAYVLDVAVDHDKGGNVYYEGGYWSSDTSNTITVKNTNNMETAVFPGDTVVISNTYFTGKVAYFAKDLPANVQKIKVDMDVAFNAGANTPYIMSGTEVEVTSGHTLSFWQNDDHQAVVTNVVLNGAGTVKIGSSDANLIPVLAGDITGGAKINIASVDTVAIKGSVANTIIGAGTIKLDALRTLTLDASDWKGVVELPSFTADAINLNAYGNSGSTIKLNGISGNYLDPSNVSVNPAIILEGPLTLTAFSAQSYLFPSISGTGAISFSNLAENDPPTSVTITKLSGSEVTIESTLSTSVTIGTLDLTADPVDETRVLTATGNLVLQGISVNGTAKMVNVYQKTGTDAGFYVGTVPGTITDNTATFTNATNVAGVPATVTTISTAAGAGETRIDFATAPTDISAVTVTIYATDANGTKPETGAHDITGCFTINKSGRTITYALNPDAKVNDVTVKPAVGEVTVDAKTVPPMAMGDNGPEFGVKTIPGLWYSVQYSDNNSDWTTGEPQQATSSSMKLTDSNAATGNVRYYRLSTGAAKSALK